MLYIFCCFFSFYVGFKFSKIWNMLNIAYFKKEIDVAEIEKRLKKVYEEKIENYEKQIYVLTNKIDIKENEK